MFPRVWAWAQSLFSGAFANDGTTPALGASHEGRPSTTSASPCAHPGAVAGPFQHGSARSPSVLIYHSPARTLPTWSSSPSTSLRPPTGHVLAAPPSNVTPVSSPLRAPDLSSRPGAGTLSALPAASPTITDAHTDSWPPSPGPVHEHMRPNASDGAVGQPEHVECQSPSHTATPAGAQPWAGHDGCRMRADAVRQLRSRCACARPWVVRVLWFP